jgi:hypothetical protein
MSKGEAARAAPAARPFVNETHEELASCPTRTCPTRGGELVELGVPGRLRVSEALKIYELGYLTPGDALELGTGHGLGTFVLAQAVRDSGRPRRVVTVELDPQKLRAAERWLERFGLADPVETQVAEPASFCRRLAGENAHYGFVLVRHEGSPHELARIVDLLAPAVGKGGYVLLLPGDESNGPLADVAFPADAFESAGRIGDGQLLRRQVLERSAGP